MAKQQKSTSKKLSTAKAKTNAKIKSENDAILERLEKGKAEKRVSPVGPETISSAKAEKRKAMEKNVVVPKKKLPKQTKVEKVVEAEKPVVDFLAMEAEAAEQRVQNFIEFLSKKSVSELRDYAKKHGIRLNEKDSSKSKIIQSITNEPKPKKK